jgi:hypothetical protein
MLYIQGALKIGKIPDKIPDKNNEVSIVNQLFLLSDVH